MEEENKKILEEYLRQDIKKIQQIEGIFEALRTPDNEKLVNMLRLDFLAQIGSTIGTKLIFSLDPREEQMQSFIIARRKRMLFDNLIGVGFTKKQALAIVVEE